jgi:hypothetical protein
VAGEVTTSNGRTQAVRWVFDGQGWSGAPLGTPPNAAGSTANAVSASETDQLFAGSVCSETSCQAATWRSN